MEMTGVQRWLIHNLYGLLPGAPADLDVVLATLHICSGNWHIARDRTGCVAKIFKRSKIDHVMLQKQILLEKTGTSFTRFTLVQLKNIIFFDELKNFCNTIRKSLSQRTDARQFPGAE